MAETTLLNLTSLPAVVTWIGAAGQTNHLYRRDEDPSFQVALDIKYNGLQEQSGCVGLFRLRVPVHLKASPYEKTALLLYIRPERIASLLFQQSDDPELPAAQADDADAVVQAKLGSQPACLRFVLSSFADMVAPSDVPLVPAKQKPHGEQLDLLMDLAQSISFSIYFKAQDVESLSLLRDLADVITDPARGVQSHFELDDMASLYSGRGGMIVGGPQLAASGPGSVPPLPPAYDNVGAPPPMAPLDQEPVAGPSTSSKSRKRRRDSDMDEASRGPNVEAMVENMYRDFHQELNALRQSREEDRAFMMEFVGTGIQTLRSDIMTEIQNTKTQMIQYIDRCTDELDHRLTDVEREVEDTNDRIDVQVDDAVISYKVEVEDEKDVFKSEMREFVTEQLDKVHERAVEEVEESVMDRLNGARVSVEQARIRLD
ncbi:hypothetical protein VMCG_01808 [Cytospora schulzeri]|uniref:Uncharacterized protein n=1 Tax=Cytospora schulzeri TaxID=448051 RepID=A0A423X3D7_9PEZI|nr:hypothetical protein VMCG_01808 [Valsa malicola]